MLLLEFLHCRIINTFHSFPFIQTSPRREDTHVSVATQITRLLTTRSQRPFHYEEQELNSPMNEESSLGVLKVVRKV